MRNTVLQNNKYNIWSGLTRPSLITVVVAFGINVVAIIGIVLFITPDLIKSEGETIFAASPRDYDLFSTTKALDLMSKEPGSEQLILIGSSTTRAAFLEKDIRANLLSEGGQAFEVVKLCTQKQLIWDALAYVDAIPPDTAGVLILGVSAGLFGASAGDISERVSNPRFGFSSNLQESLLPGLNINPEGARVGIYAIDNARFLLGRWKLAIENIISGSSPKQIDSWYVNRQALPRPKYLKHGSQVKSRFLTYELNLDLNLQLLQTLVEHVVNKTNLSLILVEAPVNPLFVTEFELGELFSKHSRLMKNFAQVNGVKYLNMNELARLEPKDFYDWAHLQNREAIRRSSQSLVSEINSLYGS